jgi:hypothetical protein
MLDDVADAYPFVNAEKKTNKTISLHHTLISCTRRGPKRARPWKCRANYLLSEGNFHLKVAKGRIAKDSLSDSS